MIENYINAAIKAGCPEDQVQNFVRARLALQPQQLLASAAARACDAPDGPTAIGYGGARAGGKSFWLLAQMGADDCQRQPGLKCLLLRKVAKANLEHFEDLRLRVFGQLAHEFNYRGILTFANGGRIIAGHFQCEKDIDSYLGLEYDVIGIEEATTLSERKYKDIATCCRTSKRNFRPRIYSTTNPGGVGHTWYKKLFVEPYYDCRRRGNESQIVPHPHNETNEISQDVALKEPGNQRLVTSSPTLFIPARVTDNCFTNAEYGTQLSRLTGWQRRAWFQGDWDIAAGQFFTRFNRDIHVIDKFDARRARQWFAALDYGFTHYTVVLLGCRDCDGNIIVVDEHAERQWLPERHAMHIHAMLVRHELEADDLARFVAGTDVFSAQFDGSTIARQYGQWGLHLRRANTDRINGWAELLRRFGDPEAGIKPTLFIHNRCARLIETIPLLQHDPMRPEDVLKTDVDEDGMGGDDAADALRYLVHTQPAKVEVLKLRW
jgi:phage terminase large subunit